MKRSRLVIWILAPVAVLTSMLFITIAIGLSIPRRHLSQRTLKTRAAPELVWKAITDYERQPAWRKDVKRVVRLPDRDGREVWQEVYERGTPLTLETAESVAPRRLVRVVVDEGGPFSGRWEYEIETTGAGSQLTITEEGEIPNPVFRFMSRFILGQTSSIEKFQKDLAAELGEEDVIQ